METTKFKRGIQVTIACFAMTTALAQPPAPPCPNTTYWNGSSWSNGVPDETYNAVFTGNYSSNEDGDLHVCSVLVTNDAEVTFENTTDTEGHTLTVEYEVTVDPGSSLTFEHNSSLVQIENVTNSGDIDYQRTTPRITKFDYVYWSSPVDNQILADFSPDTQVDKYYEWDSANSAWVSLPNTGSYPMYPGKGYIIRGPNGFGEVLQNFDFTDGFFTGTPNNGTITTPVTGSGTFNLIGNPYPSALDADCFITDAANSTIGGALYFFAHNIPIDWDGDTPGDAIYNYNVNDYAVYNLLGGVGTGIVDIDNNFTTTNRPLGKIAAGQSFFVEA